VGNSGNFSSEASVSSLDSPNSDHLLQQDSHPRSWNRNKCGASQLASCFASLFIIHSFISLHRVKTKDLPNDEKHSKSHEILSQPALVARFLRSSIRLSQFGIRTGLLGAQIGGMLQRHILWFTFFWVSGNCQIDFPETPLEIPLEEAGRSSPEEEYEYDLPVNDMVMTPVDQLRSCGSNDLCPQGELSTLKFASGRFPGQEKLSHDYKANPYTCRCDSQCFQYGDCCIGLVINGTGNETPPPPLRPSHPWRCNFLENHGQTVRFSDKIQTIQHGGFGFELKSKNVLKLFPARVGLDDEPMPRRDAGRGDKWALQW